MVNWTNVTDFGMIPAAANSASGDLFWVGMLHMLWIILFLVMIAYGFEVAILVSSFLALILSLLFVYSDLIAWGYPVEFAGIILFMFLYITWSGQKT